MSDDYGCVKGIFQGDIIIKTAIELALEDMKKNPYIIDDVFASLIENPLLNQKYGIKEVNRAHEFILNNKIHIFMAGRMDKEEFPCVTISVGSSSEDNSLATLGDNSHMVEELEPDEIGKKIQYIISPFTPVSYDKDTGIIEVPEDTINYEYVREGMVVIDPDTGAGFLVSGKAGIHGIQIAAGSDLTANKVGVVPEYQVYRARRERATSQETYNIGCHAHGDSSTLIFLHSVVKYALYRYREALLEHENFQNSTQKSSDMLKNGSFTTENVYSRFITLSGQVEETWLKSPKRIIEGVGISGDASNTREDGTEYVSEEVAEIGIKILSQDAPESIDLDCETWVTIDEE